MSVDTNGSEFVVEQTKADAKMSGIHDSLLQECEKDIIWYRDNFLGKVHLNYLATESNAGPVAVSVIKDEDQFKGSERAIVPTSSIATSIFRRLFGFGPSMRDVFAAAGPNKIPADTVTLCRDPNLPNELLSMEERQVIRSYKFGSCCLKPGQSTEEEMFSNRYEDISPAYKQFLNFLGERIELKGWKGYRAGLDVSEDHTGTHSYYTKWQGYEIMFHVSVLLPFNESDKQQLERKRHIGNDIVVIVFQESDVPFNLSTITTKQNHYLAFVKPKGDGYMMTACYKQGVPLFTPDLPEPTYFERNAVSRDFFLHKLINAERACYKAPSFAPKISRTRSVLLLDVAQRFIGK